MKKETAITVRLPSDLKHQLQERAKRERRSISGQVVFELERAVAGEWHPESRTSALGLFKGSRTPSDEEFDEARALLWKRLEKPVD